MTEGMTETEEATATVTGTEAERDQIPAIVTGKKKKEGITCKL